MQQRPLSSYDYTGILCDPQTLGVAIGEQQPLPTLSEPTDLPPVTTPAPEPLVTIQHQRVQTIPVYHQAGWSTAQPEVLVRTGVAVRLAAAADTLEEQFGLAVLDGWRPLALQRDIYDAAYADETLPAGYVSVPSEDPQTPPPHLSGGTVDVTLTFDGHPLRLGTDFDDFTELAAADSLESTPGTERELRRMLYWAMRSAGFVVIDCEWWHYEHGTRRWAALTGNNPIYGPAEHNALT